MRRVLHTVCALLTAIGSASAQPQTESLSGNAEQIWHGAQAGSNAGAWLDLGAVSSSDSRSDLIIGAPGNSVLPGMVYVIFGGPTRSGDLSLDHADTTIAGSTANDRFGFATAAGNVVTAEGSQTRNLVVGAPGAFGGKGAIYVYLGGFVVNSHLTTGDAVFTIVGRSGDQLGSALATADLDNDGYREIIVGAPGNDRIYVIKGGPSLSGTRDLTVSPPVAPDLEIAGLGLGDVLAAGDVTGDGISDLLVGTSEAESGAGVVFLYKGKSTGGIPTQPDTAFVGSTAGDHAGASLRLLDIDHDGIRDVIIGAPGVDGPAASRPDAGAVYLLWGGAALTGRYLGNSDVTFHGAAAGMNLGSHVSAGDINRDTPSDIVMLAPGSSGSAGELDIYYGRSVRTQYGVDRGDGMRVVDFADATQIGRRIVGDPALGAISFTNVFEVTGEGARDIVASVASQDSSTGAVYFTISPSLSLDTSSVSMVLTHDQTGTSANTITISNRSIVSTTWAATSAQPWLTATPATGASTSAAPSTFKVQVNTTGLAPGSYSGTLNIKSTSPHLDMTIPISVSLTVTDTLMSLDGPADGATVTVPFLAFGWAIDRGASSGTGVDSVAVFATNADDPNAKPLFAGFVSYGVPRSDIGGIYGSQFTNSGYQTLITALPSGRYHLTAYAHQAAANTYTASATRDITVVNTGIVWMDTPSESRVVTSAFEVGGWAIDPASSTGTGVDGVQCWIYPNDGAAMPVFIGDGSYGWARGDVGAAWGSRFTNSGYHFTVTGMTPGQYVVAIVAHSTATNAYTAIRAVHVTVNANALMSVDSPSAESTMDHSSFLVGGWAIDRAAVSGTGVDAIHIYLVPNPGSGETPIFVGVGTLGASRPDVAGLYGSRYQNSGYNLTVDGNALGLTPGIYDVAVWAHSSATGTFNNVAVVRIHLE